MRKGKKFESQIKSVLSNYAFIYKFRDFAMNTKGAYRISVPSDFLMIHDGKAYFLECKEFKGKRFYKRNIRGSQLDYGDKIMQNGGMYVFLLHNSDLNTIFVIDYLNLMAEFEIEASGRQSLRISQLAKYPYVKAEGKYSEKLFKEIIGLKNILRNVHLFYGDTTK